MSNLPTIQIPQSKLRLGLFGRVALLILVFLCEKIFLNEFVDFDRAQAAHGFGAVVRDTQHWGFRFAVAFAAALSLFGCVQKEGAIRSASCAMESAGVRVYWLILHVACVVCLVPLSYLLYRDGSLPLPTTVFLWLTFAGTAFASATIALAPWQLWRKAADAFGPYWIYALFTAVLATSSMQLSQQLWTSTASLTYHLVRLALAPIIPDLMADPVSHVISTRHFAVVVTEVCSGLEGIGLTLAFIATWLVYFRGEFRFPRALILVPVGIVSIFLLNVARISALVLIGHAGFPEIAIYGFHSQAGWISFLTVACSIAYLSQRNRWLQRQPQATANLSIQHNPTAVYLMPLLAILAAGALSHAMSGRFETMYPLRLLAVSVVLWFYRGDLLAIDWRFTWRGPVLGLLVFIGWVIAGRALLPVSKIPDALTSFSDVSREIWISSRVLVSVVFVSIAEELAYRGYLMRRLCRRDFESVQYTSVHWPALLASAVAFGAGHGTLWLPGIVAGAVYAIVVKRTGRLGEAVAAHASTNALIALAVLWENQWQFW